MVAQRSCNSRFKTFINLTFLVILGCSEPQLTIVEIKNISTDELKPIIQRYTQDRFEYDIASNKIVFYAASEDIKDLIALLESLDSGTAYYQVEFSWLTTGKHYSTHQLPSPLTLQASKTTTQTLFGEPWQVAINPLDQAKVALTLIKKIEPRKKKNEINSVRLEDGTKIKFKQGLRTEASIDEREYILNLGETVELSNPHLPVKLSVKASKLN